MFKMRILFSFIFFFVLTCALSAQTPQYHQRMVQNISVVMQHLGPGSSFDGKGVLSRMKTKEGHLFSQEDFDEDLKTLSTEFDRIEPSVQVVDGKLYITLKLWSRPLIRSINWSGNEQVKSKTLQSELGIELNAVFDRSAFNQAFHKLKTYYVKKGYFEAELSYQVKNDFENNAVDIDVTINEGRSGRIKKIVFVNFTSKEESEVMSMIMTKEYNLFLSWATEEGTYREEMVQQDELMIVDYLQNLGYADARVDIKIVESKEKNRIVIEITADKGELYTFGDISIEGGTIFNDEDIWKRILIKKGDTFSPNKLRQTAQSITNLYGNKGYIDAYASFESRLDKDYPVYHVKFSIVEGGQYKVGMVNVIGNTSTATCVILHEVLLIPGEVFNLAKLKETEARLRNIGYFKNVNVYAVKSDENCAFGSNYRDVVIEVEETSTGNFSAFMGFSTAESIFGGINITERNFNYKGIPSLFREGYSALRGGGEYAHITATLGERQQSYVLSWTKPYFMDTPWIFGFDIDRTSNKMVSTHYGIEAVGLTLHSRYPINQFMLFGWKYRIRDSDVCIPENASPRLELEAKNSGLISGTGISLIYDSTTNLNKPTGGLRSHLDLEYVGLGGRNTFWSFGYINTLYYQLHCRGILKFRGDVRFISPVGNTDLDSLPLDERLYLGGETTVRGYRPYIIGPLFGPGDPSGGLSSVLVSAEYDLEIFSKLDAFVFFDSGSVSGSAWSIDTMRSSVGYGVRLRVMEGGPPVVLGMGYPINPRDKNDVKRFFLSIGARF